VDDTRAQEETRKQREMVINEYVQSYRRLQGVASRIVVSGRELCGDKVAPYYGFTAWTQENFGKEWRDVVAAGFGIDTTPTVASVAPGSVAYQAGMKEGDIVRSVNGWIPSIGKDTIARFNEKIAAEGKLGVPVEFTVQRGTEEIKLSMMPEQACDFSVDLSPDDVKNAYADGSRIVIYKGMMEFFRSDEEVALVVSHELAHNAMKHIDAQQTNSTVGGIAGLLLDIAAALGGVNTGGDFSRAGSAIGAGVYSVDFEKEADYVGLYFMALANYDISDAPNFWRRMATTNSKAITMKSTHPTTPERFLGLETAVGEIKQKIEHGELLRPELGEIQTSKTTPEQPQVIPH
jgi:membrane-associated protease RseP (regulator of RpoE activity)